MSEQLTPDEIRARATRGAAVLGLRGIAIYGIGIAANLVLASLLVPRDFGLFAIGYVVVVFGTYIAEGGLGAGLIRREARASRSELQSVLGFQLALTTAIAAAALAAGAAFGRDGLVVATMVASLPL